MPSGLFIFIFFYSACFAVCIVHLLLFVCGYHWRGNLLYVFFFSLNWPMDRTAIQNACQCIWLLSLISFGHLKFWFSGRDRCSFSGEIQTKGCNFCSTDCYMRGKYIITIFYLFFSYFIAQCTFFRHINAQARVLLLQYRHCCWLHHICNRTMENK